MNQEIKKKWIEALRSGKYAQGTGYLHNEGKFCCLGVFCDILQPNSWTTRVGAHYAPAKAHPLGDKTDGVFGLSTETMDMFNMQMGLVNTVAMMNDNGSSFEKIAKFIEEEF